jgi:hypothetical protein
MESGLRIFASINDPRAPAPLNMNSAPCCSSPWRLRCAARRTADFVEANLAEVVEIVILPVDGTPGHDMFSRFLPVARSRTDGGYAVTFRRGQVSGSRPG